MRPSDLFAILNDANEVVPVPHMLVWAKWMKDNPERRRVAFEEFADGVIVSTLFLGTNFSFVGGDPKYFETIIFGGPHNLEKQVYATYLEAQLGHDEMVRRARGPVLH